MSINGKLLSKLFCTIKLQKPLTINTIVNHFLKNHQKKNNNNHPVLWKCGIISTSYFGSLLRGLTLVSNLDSESIFSDSDVEDNIAHLMILARLALERGDMERAEAILQMGIKICEDHKINFGLPQIYDILATMAMAEGEIEKAESIMVTIIEKLIQNGMNEDDHYIVDFKLRLARIYSGYRENDLAEIGFKTCLNTQKDKITKGDVSTRTSMLYMNVLFWYGVHMIRNERYKDAKTLLDRAHEYSQQIKGLSPYQEMVIMYTLSDLNLELGELDSALDKIKSAILLGKGISSIDLPRCYVKLAKIYLTMGVYDQAKTSAEEGAKLARIFNKFDVLDEAKIILEEVNILKK